MEGMSTGEVRPWNDEIEGFALSGGEAIVGDCESALNGERAATEGDSRGDSKAVLRGEAFIRGGSRGVVASARSR